MSPQAIEISELLAEVRLGAFNLNQIHDFPESEYYANKTRYAELEAWYDGDKLNEKQVQGGRTVDKFPIKLNPIRGAVQKHAFALFGETKDNSQPLAVPKLRSDEKNMKDVAQKGQNFLNSVWYENFGRSLMMRNGLTSQVYGGCVFKASYVPQQAWRKTPLRLEAVHPSNWVGIPMSGDEFRLEQSWVVKAMSPAEAFRQFGMEFPKEELVYYVEYWAPDIYEITVNGRLVPTGQTDDKGNDLFYQGDNPFGVVPQVYIPHIRTHDFYGDSLISQNIQGIVEEMNKRVADYGDAVSDDSHPYYVIKNTSGRPDVYELASGIRVIQLPSTPAITGKERDPDMDTLGKGQATGSMKELNEQLYDHFRREAAIPPVADGEDEGSQRSAMTLAMRMWPLLSHTSQERTWWADGLALLDQILLKIAVSKKLNKEITEKHLEMRIERHWQPILPRDQEVFINELISRASANLGSLEHLLGQLDDIEDPSEEYEAIKKQLKEMNELMPKSQFNGNNNQEGVDNKSKSTPAANAAQTKKE